MTLGSRKSRSSRGKSRGGASSAARNAFHCFGVQHEAGAIGYSLLGPDQGAFEHELTDRTLEKRLRLPGAFAWLPA